MVKVSNSAIAVDELDKRSKKFLNERKKILKF